MSRKGFYADVRTLRAEVDSLNDQPYLAVSPQHGSDTANSGTSFSSPYATVAKALSVMVDNQKVFVVGDIREQNVIAPLGIYGGQIIGLAGGRPRHTTSNGVVLDGNGSTWRELASPTATPLLLLREQGWGVSNLMMIPRTGQAAIQLRRDEDATYPDPSHAIFKGIKFISSGTRVGYGIQDIGQSYNLAIEDCEFEGLEYAYNPSAGGAFGGAAPGHHNWLRNKFTGNKTDITGNFVGSTFRGNRFHTPYHGTTHPTTINLAVTSSAGSADDVNYVLENYFADAAGNVTIAKGYKPATGDVWRNYVTDAAAAIVAVPA